MSFSFNPATNIGDLKGQVIIITGASGALGKETVAQLVKHNPSKIYLGARNEAKARDAIASIKSQSQSSSTELILLPIDTSDFASVKKAADTFISENDRLDTLILNAGIMATPASTTASGHDLQLATNHIGHHLLAKSLLPILSSTARDSDVRIINISSTAQSMAPGLSTILSTSAFNAKGPWARYGGTKACNVLFSSEFARRYPSITSVSLHPGVIKTDLWQHNDASSGPTRYFFSVFSWWNGTTVANGTKNQLWASAGAKKEELHNGGFYMPVGKLQKGNKYANDVNGGKKLWEWTEQELKKSGF